MSENINWKHLIVPADIRVNTKTSRGQLHKIGREFWADDNDPWEFTCKQCKTVTPEAHLHSDWVTAVCSNCYSERMYVTKVRLTFHNWGEHNGGDKELLGRYDAAVKTLEARKP